MSATTATIIAIVLVLVISFFIYNRNCQNNNRPNNNNTIHATHTTYQPTEKELAHSKKMIQQSPIDFKENLNAIKSSYPFIDNWHEVNFKEYEMEVYTLENCQKAQAIFDTLIMELIELGPSAEEKVKLKKFEKATLALNELNETTGGGLIETGEREDLCEIIDNIGLVCGLIPAKYGAGDGIASEWRDW